MHGPLNSLLVTSKWKCFTGRERDGKEYGRGREGESVVIVVFLVHRLRIQAHNIVGAHSGKSIPGQKIDGDDDEH